MSQIAIDFDKFSNKVLLRGDCADFVSNRFAWRYAKEYLGAILKEDIIQIEVGEKEPNKVLQDVRKMLEKYGFSETQTESSEQVLTEFYQQEKNFKNFSEKAFEIRNNNCKKDDFADFTKIVGECLTNRSLYPLQLLSAYHLAFSQNACNFSVPGAGKTSIVYGAFCYLRSLPKDHPKYVDKLLIIGPLSSFGPWENEYEECFGIKSNAKRLLGSLPKKQKEDYLRSTDTEDVTLISYYSVESLGKSIKFFLQYNKTMVVLDEAHKIKNTNGGVVAQSVLDLAKLCSAKAILTGTPVPNGYQDLYNLIEFLWPSRNIVGFRLNQLRELTENPNQEKINRLIQNIAPFFIRIKKSDLQIQPAINNPVIMVKMGVLQRKIYNFIESKYLKAFIEDALDNIDSRYKSVLANARTIRLMQAASNPSLLRVSINNFLEDESIPVEALAVDDSTIMQDILEYEKNEVPKKFTIALALIKQIINGGGKVIVWATFINTILSFKRFLKENGVLSQELYGAIPVEKNTEEKYYKDELTRERIIKTFHQSDCPFKVIIANPFAVSESISLHKVCHNAIYMERSFNAAHFVQSKDRIHRYGLGKDAKINYYYICSEDSIDETIHERLLIKEKRMIEIMESMPIPLFDNTNEDLGDEDIKAIIRDYVRRTKKN